METRTNRPPDSVEFTYSWYREFLDRIADAGYDIRPFAGVGADGPGDGEVLLRHDVDLSLDDALRMARIEAEHGVASTYCLLLTSALYNPVEGDQRDRISEIESLGHEVALHFSSHEYWDAPNRPDDDVLARRITEERVVLDTLCASTPETVSFHAPPEWALDRPLDGIERLDGIRSAYAPAYFGEPTYVADSGQRWRASPPDVSALGASAQLLAHPGLWGDDDATFDARVERSIDRTHRHTDRKTRREFLSAEGE